MKHRMNRAACLCAALLLPLLASASDPAHCYLRDVTSTGSTAYLLCEQGLVYATHDSGATWVAHDTGATVTMHGIAFYDATHGFAVGDDGTLLATGDGARTWQARPSGTKEHLRAVFTLGNLAWASGYDGILLHSTDAGHTWSKQTSGTTLALEALFFLDPDHGWAVGWSGTILRTSDGGKKWLPVQTAAASWSLAAVRFIDGQIGWAVGFSGQLLRSRDGGATWEAQKSPSMSSLSSVAVDSAHRIWIAGDDRLLVSEDSGANWRAIPVDGNFFVIRLFPLGNTLCGLAELGIVRQQASGLEWKHDESFAPAGAHIGNSLNETTPAPPLAGAGKSK